MQARRHTATPRTHRKALRQSQPPSDVALQELEVTHAQLFQEASAKNALLVERIDTLRQLQQILTSLNCTEQQLLLASPSATPKPHAIPKLPMPLSTSLPVAPAIAQPSSATTSANSGTSSGARPVVVDLSAT